MSSHRELKERDGIKITQLKLSHRSSIFKTYESFLSSEQADDLLRNIKTQIPFLQFQGESYGTHYTVPRRQFFFGNGPNTKVKGSVATMSIHGKEIDGNGYAYSGKSYAVFEWGTPVHVLREYERKNDIAERYIKTGRVRLPIFNVGEYLEKLMHKINRATGLNINSALLNEYRGTDDGLKNYIPDHRDKEVLLATQHPDKEYHNCVYGVSLGGAREFRIKEFGRSPKDGGEYHRIIVRHGDMMRMSGTFHKYYTHGIPWLSAYPDYRVSITFREIPEDK